MPNDSLLISPSSWSGSCVGKESTLHQISPYIGKMKSTMARNLIESASARGDTVFDPFVGSGAIALESLILGRGIICSDTNPYAVVLTKAKLFPPATMHQALTLAEEYLDISLNECSNLDISEIPEWVSKFFHPKTLREILSLVNILRNNEENFLLSCILGILHHQRPGFLSFPACHSIPYLRTKAFPKEEYPSLYAYREVKPRFLNKIRRVYRRFPIIDQVLIRECYLQDMTTLELQNESVDAVVTSPPYMNALDYVRDNRLRLWFLGYTDNEKLHKGEPMGPKTFQELMSGCFKVIKDVLRPDKKCCFVTGELCNSKSTINTAEVVLNAALKVGGFKLEAIMEDHVPQDRRVRKGSCRVKREWIVVLRKEI